jgi:23S rRNA A2030 N6-methylase RlmJ
VSHDPRAVLWNHFVLARSLDRVLRVTLSRAADDADLTFCYTDTHAGSGRLPPLAPHSQAVLAARDQFGWMGFFDALEDVEQYHPGSWVLASRIMAQVPDPRLEYHIDVNDIDQSIISEAHKNRETGRVRYWSHDWFQFVLARLAMATPPQFVTIDPPPDDPRGLAYAIDAAILLDTMHIPYLVTYPASSPQEAIDQIGRTGLELRLPEGGQGVLLGGGAERVVLDILPDLRHLAGILGGTFEVRLPVAADDYVI